MRIKMFAVAAVAMLLALFAVGCGDNTTVGKGNPDVEEAQRGEALPENAFRMTLYPKYAPITCENFLSLVSDGFYDGLIFHRVVEDFMAQGGDPQGTGMGGSKQQIKGEFSSNGVKNTLSHTRGIVSMARSSAPNSASSQFFICYSDKDTFLDGNYAAFGKVTEGMEVVDDFLKVKRVKGSDGAVSKPTSPIKIKKATVMSNDADGNPRVQFIMEDFLSGAETVPATTATTTAQTTTTTTTTTLTAVSVDTAASSDASASAESTAAESTTAAAKSTTAAAETTTAAESTSAAAESTTAAEIRGGIAETTSSAAAS